MRNCVNIWIILRCLPPTCQAEAAILSASKVTCHGGLTKYILVFSFGHLAMVDFGAESSWFESGNGLVRCEDAGRGVWWEASKAAQAHHGLSLYRAETTWNWCVVLHCNALYIVKYSFTGWFSMVHHFSIDIIAVLISNFRFPSKLCWAEPSAKCHQVRARALWRAGRTRADA